MRFPFLITLQTRHYDYKFHIEDKNKYNEVGLEILKMMRNDLKWIEDPSNKKPDLKKSLEKAFDLPYDKIQEAYKSPLNKHIKLIGKKASYYASGYDTPHGANVIEQVENIKKNLGLNLEREEYINKALDKIDNNDTKGVWDIVYYFSHDNITRDSYDN